jgi:MFS family permease
VGAVADAIEQPPRLFTRNFSALAAATFLAVMPAGMLLPTVPIFAQSQLSAGHVAVGIAVGATSLTSFLALPFVGRLADHRGRRPFLLAGPLLVAAAATSLHAASTLTVLVAIRALGGIGEAMVAVSATTAATDLAPPGRRGEAISVFSLAFQGGIAIGPVVATELLRDDRFWLVWTAAGSSALLAALIASRLPETRPARTALRRPTLLAHGAVGPALVLALALVGYGGFTAFAAIYARELGLERVGFVFLIFAATVIGIRSFGRRIPDRLGPGRCAALALSVIAAGLVTIALAGTVPGLLAGAALLGTGHALGFPALMSLAIQRSSPDERSGAVGTIAAGSQVAIGAGAIALGAIASLGGYRVMFAAGAAAAAVGLGLLRVLTRDRVATLGQP